MRTRAWVVPLQCGALFLSLAGRPAAADEALLRNPFKDPMLQISHGIAGCPEPQEPIYTQEQYSQAAHERAQRGVSCWLAGRCRLSNSYLYDSEIIPRVKRAIEARGAYEDTSVWAIGQRRVVSLRGCVRSAAQAREIEAIVRGLDDVEGVLNELMVGTDGSPPYAVRKDSRKASQ